MENQILRTRAAALRLSKQQFDLLSVSQVSAIAQAFSLGGKIYSPADRKRVWDKLREKKS